MSGHKCDEALANLYRYLDQEMEEVELTRIRVHLEDCTGCLDIYQFEERLKVVVRERLSEDVPAEFIERLRAALASESAAGA